ncbi:hypothetical protein NFI96_009820 [Prochilodus magdalenae]|nr:hypothetical protein NFI96_009820 [Prochilodus magdalenae]
MAHQCELWQECPEPGGATRRQASTPGDLEEAVGGQQPSSRTATSAFVQGVTGGALPEPKQNNLRQATNVHVSAQMVRDRLHEDGVRARHPQMGVVLTAQDRAGSLAFAREHQDWEIRHWRPVLFTDESRFTLSTCDKRDRVWRRRGESSAAHNILQHDRFGSGQTGKPGLKFQKCPDIINLSACAGCCGNDFSMASVLRWWHEDDEKMDVPSSYPLNNLSVVLMLNGPVPCEGLAVCPRCFWPSPYVSAGIRSSTPYDPESLNCVGTIVPKVYSQCRLHLAQVCTSSNEEISGKSLVNVVPMRQARHPLMKQASVQDTRFDFVRDSDSSPWRTHLGMYRRTCAAIDPNHHQHNKVKNSSGDSSSSVERGVEITDSSDQSSDDCAGVDGNKRQKEYSSEDSRKLSAPAVLSRRRSSGSSRSTHSAASAYHYPFPQLKSPRKSEAARRLGLYSSF